MQDAMIEDALGFEGQQHAQSRCGGREIDTRLFALPIDRFLRHQGQLRRIPDPGNLDGRARADRVPLSVGADEHQSMLARLAQLETQVGPPACAGLGAQCGDAPPLAAHTTGDDQLAASGDRPMVGVDRDQPDEQTFARLIDLAVRADDGAVGLQDAMQRECAIASQPGRVGDARDDRVAVLRVRFGQTVAEVGPARSVRDRSVLREYLTAAWGDARGFLGLEEPGEIAIARAVEGELFTQDVEDHRRASDACAETIAGLQLDPGGLTREEDLPVGRQ